MNADITLAGRQFEEQQDYWIDRGRDYVAIGLGEPMLDETVADEAAVDEDEDRIAIELLDLGLGNEAVEAHLAWICGAGFPFIVTFFAAPRRGLGQADTFEGLNRGERNQLVEGFLAEDLMDALAVSRHGRGYQHGI